MSKRSALHACPPKTYALYLLTAAIATLTLTACGGQLRFKKVADLDSKYSNCDASLYEVYARTYHPLVRSIGCFNCHAPGGIRADAPFAHPDPNVGYWDFEKRTPARVNSRFAEGHQQSILGYNYDAILQARLAGYLQEWNTVEAACAMGGTSVMTDGLTSNIFDPAGINDLNKCGVGDPLRADHLNFPVVTWNLGSLRTDLAGVTLKISVKAEGPVTIGGNICAHTGYRAGSVTITTDKALRLKNLKIYLNGSSYSVNTFMVERTIPANSVNYQLIASASGGYSIFNSGSAIYTDKWSVQIESLEVIK